MHHEGWYDHLWHKKWGVVTRGYSDNSKLPTWHNFPFGSLLGMLPLMKNVVLVSVLLLDAGRRWCQGEICSHSEASTACSLSEHDGKCTSLFSIFTECKSVKPLMVCHLDGNCSPFRGRQVKLQSMCVLSFDVENIQSLGWLLPYSCARTVNNIKRTIITWQASPAMFWNQSESTALWKRRLKMHHVLGAKRL